MAKSLIRKLRTDESAPIVEKSNNVRPLPPLHRLNPTGDAGFNEYLSNGDPNPKEKDPSFIENATNQFFNAKDQTDIAQYRGAQIEADNNPDSIPAKIRDGFKLLGNPDIFEDRIRANQKDIEEQSKHIRITPKDNEINFGDAILDPEHFFGTQIPKNLGSSYSLFLEPLLAGAGITAGVTALGVPGAITTGLTSIGVGTGMATVLGSAAPVVLGALGSSVIGRVGESYAEGANVHDDVLRALKDTNLPEEEKKLRAYKAFQETTNANMALTAWDAVQFALAFTPPSKFLSVFAKNKITRGIARGMAANPITTKATLLALSAASEGAEEVIQGKIGNKAFNDQVEDVTGEHKADTWSEVLDINNDETWTNFKAGLLGGVVQSGGTSLAGKAIELGSQKLGWIEKDILEKGNIKETLAKKDAFMQGMVLDAADQGRTNELVVQVENLGKKDFFLNDTELLMPENERKKLSKERTGDIVKNIQEETEQYEVTNKRLGRLGKKITDRHNYQRYRWNQKQIEEIQSDIVTIRKNDPSINNVAEREKENKPLSEADKQIQALANQAQVYSDENIKIENGEDLTSSKKNIDAKAFRAHVSSVKKEANKVEKENSLKQDKEAFNELENKLKERVEGLIKNGANKEYAEKLAWDEFPADDKKAYTKLQDKVAKNDLKITATAAVPEASKEPTLKIIATSKKPEDVVVTPVDQTKEERVKESTEKILSSPEAKKQSKIIKSLDNAIAFFEEDSKKFDEESKGQLNSTLIPGMNRKIANNIIIGSLKVLKSGIEAGEIAVKNARDLYNKLMDNINKREDFQHYSDQLKSDIDKVVKEFALTQKDSISEGNIEFVDQLDELENEDSEDVKEIKVAYDVDNSSRDFNLISALLRPFYTDEKGNYSKHYGGRKKVFDTFFEIIGPEKYSDLTVQQIIEKARAQDNPYINELLNELDFYKDDELVTIFNYFKSVELMPILAYSYSHGSLTSEIKNRASSIAFKELRERNHSLFLLKDENGEYVNKEEFADIIHAYETEKQRLMTMDQNSSKVKLATYANELKLVSMFTGISVADLEVIVDQPKNIWSGYDGKSYANFKELLLATNRKLSGVKPADEKYIPRNGYFQPAIIKFILAGTNNVANTRLKNGDTLNTAFFQMNDSIKKELPIKDDFYQEVVNTVFNSINQQDKLFSRVNETKNLDLSYVKPTGKRGTALIESNLIFKRIDETQRPAKYAWDANNAIFNWWNKLGKKPEVFVVSGIYGEIGKDNKVELDERGMTADDLMAMQLKEFLKPSFVTDGYLQQVQQFGDKSQIVLVQVPKHTWKTNEERRIAYNKVIKQYGSKGFKPNSVTDSIQVYKDFIKKQVGLGSLKFNDIQLAGGLTEQNSKELTNPERIQKNYENVAANFVVNSLINGIEMEAYFNGKNDGIQYKSWQEFLKRSTQNISTGMRMDTNIEGGVGKKYRHIVLNEVPLALADYFKEKLGGDIEELFDGMTIYFDWMGDKLVKSNGNRNIGHGQTKMLDNNTEGDGSRFMMKSNWIEITPEMVELMPELKDLYLLAKESQIDAISFTSGIKVGKKIEKIVEGKKSIVFDGQLWNSKDKKFSVPRQGAITVTSVGSNWTGFSKKAEFKKLEIGDEVEIKLEHNPLKKYSMNADPNKTYSTRFDLPIYKDGALLGFIPYTIKGEEVKAGLREPNEIAKSVYNTLKAGAKVTVVSKTEHTLGLSILPEKEEIDREFLKKWNDTIEERDTNNLLVQQDLTHNPELDSKNAPRQIFRYAFSLPEMMFKGENIKPGQYIQKLINNVIDKKSEKFRKVLLDMNEDQYREYVLNLIKDRDLGPLDFVKGMLEAGVSVYHPFIEQTVRNLVYSQLNKKVLDIKVNGNLNTEVPDPTGKLQPMRIINGMVKAAECFVPAKMNVRIRQSFDTKTAAYDFASGYKDLLIEHNKVNPSKIIEKDGKWIVEGERFFMTRVPTTHFHSMTYMEAIGRLPERSGNIIIVDGVTQKISGSDNDGDQRHSWARFVGNKLSAEEQAMNEAFDVFEQTYLNPDNYEMLTTPISTDHYTKLDTEESKNANVLYDFEPDSELNLNLPDKLVSVRKATLEGKDVVGIMANSIAMYKYFEAIGARLRNPIQLPVIRFSKNGIFLDSESLSKSIEGKDFKYNLKTDFVLANLMNLVVDDTKHQKLSVYGINSSNAGWVSMLIKLLTDKTGNPDEKTIINFLHLPTVNSYIKSATDSDNLTLKLSENPLSKAMEQLDKEAWLKDNPNGNYYAEKENQEQAGRKWTYLGYSRYPNEFPSLEEITEAVKSDLTDKDPKKQMVLLEAIAYLQSTSGDITNASKIIKAGSEKAYNNVIDYKKAERFFESLKDPKLAKRYKIDFEKFADSVFIHPAATAFELTDFYQKQHSLAGTEFFDKEWEKKFYKGTFDFIKDSSAEAFLKDYKNFALAKALNISGNEIAEIYSRLTDAILNERNKGENEFINSLSVDYDPNIGINVSDRLKKQEPESFDSIWNDFNKLPQDVQNDFVKYAYLKHGYQASMFGGSFAKLISPKKQKQVAGALKNFMLDSDTEKQFAYEFEQFQKNQPFQTKKGKFDSKYQLEGAASERPIGDDIELDTLIKDRLRNAFPNVNEKSWDELKEIADKEGLLLNRDALGAFYMGTVFINEEKAVQSTMFHEYAHFYWASLPDSNENKQKLLELFGDEETAVEAIGQAGVDIAKVSLPRFDLNYFKALLQKFWYDVKKAFNIKSKEDYARLFADEMWDMTPQHEANYTNSEIIKYQQKIQDRRTANEKLDDDLRRFNEKFKNQLSDVDDQKFFETISTEKLKSLIDNKEMSSIDIDTDPIFAQFKETVFNQETGESVFDKLTFLAKLKILATNMIGIGDINLPGESFNPNYEVGAIKPMSLATFAYNHYNEKRRRVDISRLLHPKNVNSEETKQLKDKHRDYMKSFNFQEKTFKEILNDESKLSGINPETGKHWVSDETLRSLLFETNKNTTRFNTTKILSDMVSQELFYRELAKDLRKENAIGYEGYHIATRTAIELALGIEGNIKLNDLSVHWTSAKDITDNQLVLQYIEKKKALVYNSYIQDITILGEEMKKISETLKNDKVSEQQFRDAVTVTFESGNKTYRRFVDPEMKHGEAIKKAYDFYMGVLDKFHPEIVQAYTEMENLQDFNPRKIDFLKQKVPSIDRSFFDVLIDTKNLFTALKHQFLKGNKLDGISINIAPVGSKNKDIYTLGQAKEMLVHAWAELPDNNWIAKLWEIKELNDKIKELEKQAEMLEKQGVDAYGRVLSPKIQGRLPYKVNFEESEIESPDLWGTMQRYMDTLIKNKHFEPTLPFVHYAANYYSENKAENVRKWIDIQTSTIYYGEAQKNMHIPETFTGLAKALHGFTAWRFLALNPSGAMYNFFAGQTGAFRELGPKLFFRGYGRVIQDPKKAYKMLSDNKVVNSIVEKDLSSAKKNWTSLQNVMFSLIQIVETMNQGVIYLGRISEEEWKTGNVSPERNVKITNEIRDISGPYDLLNQRPINAYLEGRMLMQFKNWLPDMFRMLFSKRSIDYLGNEKQGVLNTLNSNRDALLRAINPLNYKETLAKLKDKQTWENLTEAEKQNTWKSVRLLVMGSGLLLASMGFDDDDEEEKKIKKGIMRVMYDLTFFMSLDSIGFLFDQPVPVQSTILELILGIQNLVNYILKKEDSMYTRDTEMFDEGDPKFYRNVNNLAPWRSISREVFNTLDLND